MIQVELLQKCKVSNDMNLTLKEEIDIKKGV